jgi:hypothetical protein
VLERPVSLAGSKILIVEYCELDAFYTGGVYQLDGEPGKSHERNLPLPGVIVLLDVADDHSEIIGRRDGLNGEG